MRGVREVEQAASATAGKPIMNKRRESKMNP
jgi:hypothetical protein